MRVFSVILVALVCTACLDTPTKRVGSGEPSRDAGPDGNVGSGDGGPTPCTSERDCTSREFSRCGADGFCTACETGAECEQFGKTPVCVAGQGCFACGPDDASKCVTPRSVCSSEFTCVECTAEDNTTCDGTEVPFCELSSGTCVACRNSDDCGDIGRAECTDRVCKPCTSDEACAHFEDTKHCDTATQKCVGCRNDNDCGVDAPVCDTATGRCGGCTEGAQCARFADASVCSGGACVECTAAERGACRTADNQPAACNVVEQRCDASRGVGRTGACEPCVSDHECVAGHLCVQTTFDSVSQGRYCMPTTTAGCELRPYAKYEMGLDSIEGVTVNACTLRFATCAATTGVTGYSANCGVDSAEQPVGSGAVRWENDLCGASGLDDGFCVNTAPGQYRCTLPCFADEDCPNGAGITCQTRMHETGSAKLCTL